METRRNRSVHIIIVVAVVVLTSQVCLGSRHLPAVLSPILELMPELAAAPGPGWMREGLRLSYWVMGSQRQGQDTSSGASLAEFDVVAIDGAHVVLSNAIYTNTGTSFAAPVYSGYALGAPGGGDFWIDPGSLATAPRLSDRELVVVPLSTVVNGRNYDAMRFEYTQGAHKLVTMYDRASGVMISHSHAMGNLDTTKQGDLVMWFVGMRQLTLPWTGGSIPAWVVRGRTLRWDGIMAVSMGHGPAAILPLSVVGQIEYVGENWATIDFHRYLNGMLEGQFKGVSGSAQITGGFYLPAEAMAVLRPGDLLDRDPLSRAEIRVGQPGIVPAMRDAVSIVRTGPGYSVVMGFDRRTGAMVYYSEAQQTGLTAIKSELRLVSGP